MRHFNHYDPEVKLGRTAVYWNDGKHDLIESVIVDPQRDYVARRLYGALFHVTEDDIDRVLFLSGACKCATSNAT